MSKLRYALGIIGLSEFNLTFVCDDCHLSFEKLLLRWPSREELIVCPRCRVSWIKVVIDGGFHLE